MQTVLYQSVSAIQMHFSVYCVLDNIHVKLFKTVNNFNHLTSINIVM